MHIAFGRVRRKTSPTEIGKTPLLKTDKIQKRATRRTMQPFFETIFAELQTMDLQPDKSGLV